MSSSRSQSEKWKNSGWSDSKTPPFMVCSLNTPFLAVLCTSLSVVLGVVAKNCRAPLVAGGCNIDVTVTLKSLLLKPQDVIDLRRC